MHHVYDPEHGYRDLDDAKYAAWRAESDAADREFWARLTWLPIDDYDRASGRPQLLRHGDEWAFGFWGPGSAEWLGDDADLTPRWRNVQESYMEQPLDFEPTEFAVIEDQDTRVSFMADM